MHFCIKCIFAQLNIFLWKMYAKMHFGIKCIFASNAFLQRKTKCTHLCFLQSKKHSIFASNAFDALQKCIFASNAFLQRTDFVFCKAKKTAFCRFLTFWFALQKCIWCQNAFDAKMHFCTASHFPKENVQQRTNKMLQMHLMRTFCFAEHFPLENVRVALPKCILATHSITFSKGKCSASGKLGFCTFCFAKCKQKLRVDARVAKGGGL